MHCTRLIFMAKKHLYATILKSSLSKLAYFQISQNFFWIKDDTQKATKSHIQQGNYCSLKTYRLIYIDHIGCIALGSFLWQNESQCSYFKLKFKQTFVFLDFSKLLLDGK